MKILSFFLILFLFSCPSNPNQPATKNESVVNFDLKKDFKITSNQKVIDKKYSKQDQLICADWNIEKQNLKKIMQSMQSIQGREWHYLFDHFACEISGELIQNKNVFKYSINSGSWMTVYNQDTVMRFGDTKKLNEALFISPVLELEDEK